MYTIVRTSGVSQTSDFSHIARYAVRIGDLHRFYVEVRLPEHLDPAVNLLQDPAVVGVALAEVAVRRIEEGLRSGVLGAEHPAGALVSLDLGPDDVASLLKVITHKPCSRQRREASGLFCDAASRSDATALDSSGPLRIAPTTFGMCSDCEMPSTHIACVNLCHARVSMTPAGAPRFSETRHLDSAMCELGLAGAEAPHRCHGAAGGHDCWRREVSVGEAIPAPLHPLALVEAIDFLNAAWRLRFGAWLLPSGLPATVPATLGQPVDSRREFDANIGALAQAIEVFKVSKGLLGPQSGAQRSIGRMGEALQEAGLDCGQHLDALRAVIAVRRATQHVDRAGELTAGLAAIGAPETSWSDAWLVVTARTVEAMRGIRDELLADAQSDV